MVVAVRARPNATCGGHRLQVRTSILRGKRSRLGRLDQLVQDAPKLRQTRGRDDNRVPTPRDILGDSEEATARILLQCEQEDLTFDLQTFSPEGFLRGGWARTFRPISGRGWSFARKHRLCGWWNLPGFHADSTSLAPQLVCQPGDRTRSAVRPPADGMRRRWQRNPAMSTRLAAWVAPCIFRNDFIAASAAAGGV